jgi:hypothetical protein
VRLPVEGRELQPLFEIRRGLLVRQVTGEVLQQHRLNAAEPAPLGGDPRIEHRAARDLEALEQFAAEQRRERLLLLRA